MPCDAAAFDSVSRLSRRHQGFIARRGDAWRFIDFSTQYCQHGASTRLAGHITCWRHFSSRLAASRRRSSPHRGRAASRFIDVYFAPAFDVDARQAAIYLPAALILVNG